MNCRALVMAECVFDSTCWWETNSIYSHYMQSCGLQASTSSPVMTAFPCGMSNTFFPQMRDCAQSNTHICLKFARNDKGCIHRRIKRNTHTLLSAHIFALKHGQNAHRLTRLGNIDWESLSGSLACTMINHWVYRPQCVAACIALSPSLLLIRENPTLSKRNAHSYNFNDP